MLEAYAPVSGGGIEREPVVVSPKDVYSPNDFGLALLRQLGDDRICVSPYSVSAGMAMAYGGAGGETKSEIEKVFGFEGEDIHSYFQVMESRLESENQASKIVLANAMWGDINQKFDDTYVNKIGMYYGAEPSLLKFKKTGKAIKSINKWLSKQTEGEISGMIKKGGLSKTTRLVLTNAVYFKGSWEKPFSEDETKEGSFVVSEGAGVPTTVTVPFMHQTGKFPFYMDDDVALLELPYEGGEQSMVILMPKEVGTLGEYEASLKWEDIKGLMKKSAKAFLHIEVPKFDMGQGMDMAEVLGKMGVNQAFSSHDADFSGMTGKAELYIDRMMHQANISVDEKGTVASAATSVELAPKGIVQKFKVDQAFLFFILDKESDSILFLGRETNPSL